MIAAHDRLVLVLVKVERAKKHLTEFEVACAPLFTDKGMYVIGTKTDPNTGEHTPYSGPLPILPFNVIATAGDVIQNLRSALDHLAYHLAQVGLTGGDPHKDVCFPIGATAEIYEARKTRKVQGMRQEAVEAIDRLKPYKGGNEPLWKIHELNNIDKHRNLFTVASDFLFTGAGFDGGYWLKARNPVFDGIIERVAKPQFNPYLYVSGQKPLDESGVIKSQALLPTLQQLVDFTEHLITSFESLLQ